MWEVVRTVAAPPSIVVRCGGAVLRVVVCGVVLVVSCVVVVWCCSCRVVCCVVVVLFLLCHVVCCSCCMSVCVTCLSSHPYPPPVLFAGASPPVFTPYPPPVFTPYSLPVLFAGVNKRCCYHRRATAPLPPPRYSHPTPHLYCTLQVRALRHSQTVYIQRRHEHTRTRN